MTAHAAESPLSMKFNSLEPFIPSGSHFENSRQLFLALGFSISWDGGDYVGFAKDGCRFILQKYDNPEFANNLMISVGIDNADEFWAELNEKKITEKFDVRVGKPIEQPYGKEVNIIDLAGVCWHFVEAK